MRIPLLIAASLLVTACNSPGSDENMAASGVGQAENDADSALTEEAPTSLAFVQAATPVVKAVADVGPNDMILDVGPQTAARFAELLKAAKTILWNGPVGVFEVDAFGGGTEALSRAIAESDAFSIAGGGDTLAAIDKYGVADQVSYISTGGGAFLEFVEGKVLPAVEVLEQRAKA